MAFYDKPLTKFVRILETYFGVAPKGLDSFMVAMPIWLRQKLWIPVEIEEALESCGIRLPPGALYFPEHHESHAASAFYPSPFPRAAILTVDGVGEWTTTSIGQAAAGWEDGASSQITLSEELRFPHSLGLLYSAFTAWLGFRVNSGEYKVMGMAPYGQPRYMDKLEKVVRTFPDGSFQLNMDYFSYHYSLDQSYNRRFVDLFGPPRQPESPFFTASTGDDIAGREQAAQQNQYYADVAASIQLLTEEILLKVVNHAHQQTGSKNLVMAGGVALNSVANGRIMRETPFEQVYIQPNAGDAGGALGAALYAWHVLLGKPRTFTMEHAYYGEAYDEAAIRQAIAERGYRFQRFEPGGELAERLAQALVDQKVISLFQGRFEWGPRALGNRSILADPRRAEMKDVVNSKIKFRELFRPFAPVVNEEDAGGYFDLQKAQGQYPQRFMLMVSPVHRARQAEIPAVCHMGTGRLQTVRRDWNPLYYDIIKQFGQATGVPVLMNTSFNLRAEPIVTTPANALNTFSKSDIDLLVMENYLVEKA